MKQYFVSYLLKFFVLCLLQSIKICSFFLVSTASFSLEKTFHSAPKNVVSKSNDVSNSESSSILDNIIAIHFNQDKELIVIKKPQNYRRRIPGKIIWFYKMPLAFYFIFKIGFLLKVSICAVMLTVIDTIQMVKCPRVGESPSWFPAVRPYEEKFSELILNAIILFSIILFQCIVWLCEMTTITSKQDVFVDKLI